MNGCPAMPSSSKRKSSTRMKTMFGEFLVAAPEARWPINDGGQASIRENRDSATRACRRTPCSSEPGWGVLNCIPRPFFWCLALDCSHCRHWEVELFTARAGGDRRRYRSGHVNWQWGRPQRSSARPRSRWGALRGLFHLARCSSRRASSDSSWKRAVERITWLSVD